MVQVNESGTGGVETARFAAFGGALRISADGNSAGGQLPYLSLICCYLPHGGAEPS